MRKLVYHVASTLDGFIADRDHDVSAFPTTGDHVDEYLSSLRSYGAVVMGRATYELGLRFGVEDPYPWLDTFVVSRTMAASPHPHVKLEPDGVDLARRLRAEDGAPVYLCGGGVRAGALFDASLVDEVVVKLNPLLFGDGLGLTGRLARARPLRLASAKVHDSGVVVLRYAVDAA